MVQNHSKMRGQKSLVGEQYQHYDLAPFYFLKTKLPHVTLKGNSHVLPKAKPSANTL